MQSSPAKTWSQDILLHSDPDRKIETIFKVEPPLMPIEGGHGFNGVLLRDVVNDLIQCHICGKWLKSVCHHIPVHKINAYDYRVKYGLPLSVPLTCNRTSEIQSIKASNKINLKRLEKVRETSLEKLKRITSRTKSRYMKKARNTMAHKNKFGLCPEQVSRRYMMVADIVGRDPSEIELTKHDPSLFAWMRNHYGNLNNWRKENGVDVVKRGPLFIESDTMLSGIRRFFSEHKRIPKYRDFIGRPEYPGITAIRKRFGSFRKAIELSGVKETYEE